MAKGIQIGARLDDDLVEGLDRFAERVQESLREQIGVGARISFNRSDALRLILSTYLEQGGYLNPPAAATVELEAAPSRSDQIAADLVAGNYTTQRELADRHDVDPAQVTRIKKRLQKEGKL